jgi:hypothetical protein
VTAWFVPRSGHNSPSSRSTLTTLVRHEEHPEQGPILRGSRCHVDAADLCSKGAENVEGRLHVANSTWPPAASRERSVSDR